MTRYNVAMDSHGLVDLKARLNTVNNDRRMRIVHIITSLASGGAQAILTTLVLKTRTDVEHTVVSMLDDGVHGETLRDRGVNVIALNMERGRITIGSFFSLLRILHSARPDVVQTWMYHADLLGGVAARLSGHMGIVWGIRHSDLNVGCNRTMTRGVARFCALLSRWIPALIACCSEEAARVHQNLGYRGDKFRIIPNGYDLSAFRPDGAARARVRSEWRIEKQELLIGLVGRWNAHKDHANLCRALSLLTAGGMPFRCVLVGPNMTKANPDVLALLRGSGLENRTILAGRRIDIPAVMNALDIHVLSSVGEAFPNVVAESMACGTPCVVTDVGDAALIVQHPGWVVPPRDPTALAKAIERAVSDVRREGRDAIGNRCRERIATDFSLEKMVTAYKTLWTEVNRKR